MSQTTYLRVAIPVPLPKAFDYLPDQRFTAAAYPVGARVLVPFGRTQKLGVVLEHVQSADVSSDKLKHVEPPIDSEALLDQTHLAFLRWAASYYHHPVGEVVTAALPLRLRKANAPLPLAEQRYFLAAECADIVEQLGRAHKQRELVEWIAAQGDHGVEQTTLKQHAGSALIKKLVDAQHLLLKDSAPIKSEYVPQRSPHQLNEEQQAAVDAVAQQLNQYAAFLLQGVTGSGKTEVYLRLAEQVLAHNKNVMILVPEIALTPQLQQRFAERLGEGVLLMHSGMKDTEREIAWQRLRLGLARVVLGTRSLMLNPMADLGLIVVDEEHDPSFKQQEGFRYSARDLAVVRASRAKCPVVLGSATPSLESLRNVEQGRYQRLLLNQRAGSSKPPSMHLVDLRDQPVQNGLALPVIDEIQATLNKGEQVMVFLNRRGFAPVLACYSCGWTSDCPRCDARQTVHQAAHRLWCHHCGSQQPLPQKCPSCGEHDLHPLGQGTEQLDQSLQARFNDIPLVRVDRDAAAKRGALEKLLDSVHQADAAILVGTQMLAKGHHFPKVTLVVVLDADSGLFSADYRATERMAQLLMQVAGRAGRGELPGRVLIQTRYPDHLLLQTLVNHGYEAFAQAALQERLEADYPPISHHVLLRAEANKMDPTMQFLNKVTQWGKAHTDQSVSFWGPVPAPMTRRIGRYRGHLLIQSSSREALHGFLSQLEVYLAETKLARSVRWSLDVDPADHF